MNATSLIGSFLNPQLATKRERHSNRWILPLPNWRDLVSHGLIYCATANRLSRCFGGETGTSSGAIQ